MFLVKGQVFFSLRTSVFSYRTSVLMVRTSVYRKGQVFLVIVSKGAKIRNRYNQVPHLTQEQVFFSLRTSISSFSTSVLMARTSVFRVRASVPGKYKCFRPSYRTSAFRVRTSVFIVRSSDYR